MAIKFKSKTHKRARTHGFLARKKTNRGKAVITKRRRKGRKAIFIS